MVVPHEIVTGTEEGAKSHVKLTHDKNRSFFTRSEEFILESDNSLDGDVSKTDSGDMNDECFDIGFSQSYPKVNDQSNVESEMQCKKQQTAIRCRVGLACQIGPGDLVMSGPHYRAFGQISNAQPLLFI